MKQDQCVKPKSTKPLSRGNYAALYMRLSREDENGGSESASIATQRKILRFYAKENGFAVYDEYVDDGFSGTNYDRPAFRRMLKDIEAGYVNIVITKDLSRLGRNSARTTDLLDEYFPSKKVRYIAQSEGYDSARRNGANKVVPITNVINEWYASDISDKIRDAFDIKMKNGEFIGSFAPYGYKKDPENKNHLIVDEEAAEVVHNIFELSRQGNNPSQIARQLQSENISTPAEYRCQRFPHLDIDNYSRRRKWEAGSVSKILKNICYLGHTAQGKTTKPSFKSKLSISNAPEDWIIVRNTHEPLVDEETWNIVRRLMQSRTCKKDVGFTNIFSGLAKCAECGRNMSSVGTRKKGSSANLACGGYKLYGKEECTNHHIDYDVFYNAVLNALRAQITLTEADKQALFEQMQKTDINRGQSNNDRLCEDAQKRLETIKSKTEKLFDDKYSGHIPEEQFVRLLAKYEAEQKSLSEKAERFALMCQGQEMPGNAAERHKKFWKLIEDYTEIKELSQELLFKLIDHVEVGQGKVKKVEYGRVKTQKIKIYFRFQCEPQRFEVVV